MPKLEVFPSRTLKLSNVLIKAIDDADEMDRLDITVELMDNYIKSKGAQPVGPLIHNIKADVVEDGSVKGTVKFLRQSNKFIHRIESPYCMESTLKIVNCIYLRFAGNEDDLRFGYDKLRLYAYEEGIKLKGESYAVYVDQQGDNLVVDIFMEKE